MMNKSISLKQSVLKEYLYYCQGTGVFTCVKSSGTRLVGDVAGCKNKCCGKSYKVINVNGCLYLAHRLAWLYVTGEFPECEIDHINGDGQDNRFSNLRSVTRKENQRNRRKPSNNKSGTIGVDWNENAKKWRARINLNGKEKHLGIFSSIDEAISARKKAEIINEYHENHGSDRPL